MSTALRTYYRGHTLTALREQPVGAPVSSRYYHCDQLGTTQCLTDGVGNVTDRFAADAWGVPALRTGNSINRNWYVGGWGYYRQPDAELDYVRARYLKPTQGQWLSVDPLCGVAVPMSKRTDERYTYVENRPSSAVDPSGLQVRQGSCFIVGILGFRSSSQTVRDVITTMKKENFSAAVYESSPIYPFPILGEVNLDTQFTYNIMWKSVSTVMSSAVPCVCIVAYSWGGGQGEHLARDLQRYFPNKPLLAVATIDTIRTTPATLDIQHGPQTERYAGARYQMHYYAEKPFGIPFVISPLLHFVFRVKGAEMPRADRNFYMAGEDHISIGGVPIITRQIIRTFLKRCICPR